MVLQVSQLIQTFKFGIADYKATYNLTEIGSKWDGSYKVGSSTTDYFDETSKETIGWQTTFEKAFNTWNVYTVLSLTRTSAADSTIHVYEVPAITETPTHDIPRAITGYLDKPEDTTAILQNFTNNDYARVEIAVDDSVGASSPLSRYHTALHEIGHALGLAGDNNLPADTTKDMTIMSYNFFIDNHYPITPMPYDIAAIEARYGGLGEVNQGSTEYKYKAGGSELDAGYFTGTSRSWTVLDTNANEIDTFNLSGYSTRGVYLDLRESLGKDTSGNDIWYGYHSLIRGEYVYIARGTVIENAIGTVNDDTIIGNEARNYLNGGGEDDTIYGRGNADALIGGNGEDKLYGDAGNDLLLDHYRADKSPDYLYGGVDADTLFGGDGDWLYGEAGSDTYWLNKSTAEDASNIGTNIFIAWTGKGAIDNQIKLNNTVVDKIYVKEGAHAFISGAGANDQFYWGGTLVSGTFYLQRNPHHQFVLGDSLFGDFTGGSLFLTDNKGNVIATFTNYTSGTIAGMTFYNTYGEAGSVGGYTDVPFKPNFLANYPDPAAAGTAGNDSISGSYLADSISGAAGNDTVAGSTGNDTLAGGEGTNTLTGGADRDRFVIASASNASTDTITDFNPGAGEVIDVSALGNNLTLAMTQTGADVSFAIGSRTVVMKNVNASALTTSNFVGVASLKVTVVATSGSESLTGSAGADTIDALGGDDTVSGLGGNDSLYGNSGDDVLIGGAGADTLNGGSGTDTASYAGSAAVNVNLATGATSGGHAAGDVFSSIENLIGSGNADTLAGNTGSNQILGGGGNDTILGDSGNDTLDGEAGNDSMDGGSGNDRLYGSAGADWMIGGAGTDTFDYSRSSAAVILSLLAGTASGGAAAGDTISGAEYVIGSNYNDSITGDANTNSLLGGLGNDRLSGEAGRDTMDGGDGNDALYGGADNDRLTDGLGANKLFGEAGNDTITGGIGADSLDGGDGDDMLEGGAGADTLVGGAGMDTLTYDNATAAVNVNLKTSTGSGAEAAGDKPSGIEKLIGSDFNDTLSGGAAAETIDGGKGDNTLNGDAGADSLEGGGGLDTMNGGAGNDTLDGDSGDDRLSGGADADRIDAGSGNDLLFGDAGADTLDGGSGVDTMNGGTEADVYYFAYSDTGLGTAADHIVGFSRTQGDKIEFNMSGIGASGFVGTGAFASGGVKEFGYDKITVAGVKATVIRIDYDNNGATDREIVLEGVHIDLTAADFLF